MNVTEEQDKALLNGGYDGNSASLQTWEEACAESQDWADRARRKAHYKRVRRRAFWIVLLAIAVAYAIANVILLIAR